MRRLLEIGFEQVGAWRLHNEQLVLDLARMNGQRNVLYAFILDASVLYVGKTTGSLESRMGGYLRPHATQRTNVRNNSSLLQLLREGRSIEIYAWADPGLHRIGMFHLNYAAGLEDSIIKTIAPPWNGASSTTATQSLVQSSETPLPAVGAKIGLVSSASPGSLERESATTSEIHAMELAGVIRSSPVFEVTLGKTYYHHGFFNVPVKFSKEFAEHGTEISIYCGDSRTHIRATVDRKANQVNHSPRIYGKGSLANWFGLYKRLGDTATVRIISKNEIELM